MFGALLFLVNTSRGHHLVLRYPPGKPHASADADDSSSKADVGEYTQQKDQKHQERAGSRFGIVWTVPGYERDLEQEGDQHQMDIDKTEHVVKLRRPTSASTGDDLRLLSVDDRRKTRNSRDEVEDKLFGFDASVLGNALTPKAALCNDRFFLRIDRIAYVGLPVTVTAHASPAVEFLPSCELTFDAHSLSSPLTAVSEAPASLSSPVPLSAVTPRLSQNSNRHVLSMSMFHVVIALVDPTPGEVDAVYNRIVFPLVSALKYEQERCGYVRDEVDAVLSIRDSMTRQRASESGNLVLQYNGPILDVLDALLSSSSLVQDLVHLFDHLVEGLPVSLNINQHIRVNLSMVPPDELSDIQPFHTLLLMDKPNLIAEEMKHFASPLLLNIIHSITIRRNLEVLQKRLCCTMANLLNECKFLVQWKKARVIFPVHMDAEYTLTSPMSPSALSHHIQELLFIFPTISVASFLQNLAESALKLSLLIPSKYRSDPSRSIFFDFVAELLRRDLIRSVQTYPLFISSAPSQQDDLTCGTFCNIVLDELENGDETSMEKTAVAGLAKYLNGEYSVEEIAYRERLSWRDVVGVLSGHPNIVLVYK